MSYAVEPYPKGVEITLEPGDLVARAALADLPGKNMLEAAIAAIEKALKAAEGEQMPRKLLLNSAIEAVNITERYAQRALEEVLKKLGDKVTVFSLKGRGSPKAYAYNISSSRDDSSVGDELSFDEQVFSVKDKSGTKEPVEDF
jgi:hypothetical protein